MGDNGLVIWLIVIAAVAAGLIYGLHRFALWAEARGWIYYKNGRAPLGRYGQALIDATSMFSPEIEHVIEERQSEQVRADQAESGDSDESGDS